MDFCPGINWFCESQFIDPVIEQHRVLFEAINKQTGSNTQHKVSMRYLPFKHSVGKIGVFYMSIKVISAQVGKLVDIF